MGEAHELRDLEGAVFGTVGAPVLPAVERTVGLGRLIVRSGRPVVDESDDAAVWKLRMGGGLHAFDEALEAMVAAGTKVCLRPHAEDVISDIPGALGVMRRFDGRVELVVAPADLVTAEMARAAADHVLRAVATFAEVPGVAGFVLEDVTMEGDRVAGAEPGAGLIPERVWRQVGQMVRESGKRVVVDGRATGAALRSVLGIEPGK